jgi:hypothetical protein
MSPLPQIQKEVLDRLLDPKEGLPYEYRAVLRTKLELPPEASPPPARTNAAPEKVSSPEGGNVFKLQ